MRRVADPQGTGFWQMTVLIPDRVRSAKDATFFGLPGAVTMTRVLAAKFVGSAASKPGFASGSLCAVSADANTSAVAPWVRLFANSEEPAKLNSTLTPGLSAFK